MFNLDAIRNENNKDHNKKWPYRMLIIGPSDSGKVNALLNLIQKQDNDLIDKIYLYAKDLSEPKHQFLIKKREDAGIKVSKCGVFSGSYFCIWSEYGDLRSKYPHSDRIQENTDQEKLRIWTFFTQ